MTSLPNPHYLPSTFIKVNLINFTITFKCLFEQLLSLVVLRERPELERERVSLLETITSDSLTLRELEDRSLTCLSQSGSAGVNILDDAQLVDVLKQTKQTSADIAARLERNEITEKSLNVARQKFAPIATRATVLYFTVQNLSELNVMYQFSLAWFYAAFQSCLGGVPVDEQRRAATGSSSRKAKKKSESGVEENEAEDDGDRDEDDEDDDENDSRFNSNYNDDRDDDDDENDTITPTLDRDLRKLAGNRRGSRRLGSMPKFNLVITIVDTYFKLIYCVFNKV